jgi:fatty-acyl-CoA synthase
MRALSRHPNRLAFAWHDGKMTYGEALGWIGRFQAVLCDEVLQPLRVAFLSANRADVWCAEAAVQALGGSVTWLHPMGALPDQLAQLADSEATALIVDAVTFVQRGSELAASSPQLPRVWTLGPASFGTDLLEAAKDVGEVAPRYLAQPDDLVTLNYTGGTTGKSKAAVRRQSAHAAMWRAILADFELPASPRYLAAAPISHVAGTKIVPVLLKGGTVHLMQRFEPTNFLATVERERINMSLLVPTMIYTLLDHPDLSQRDLSSLELLLYGASPMSPTRLIEALGRFGPILSQLYGQTECYPISLLRKDDHDILRPTLFSSCGAPVSATQVMLLNACDEPVPPGEAGEICVRAPHAMESYWHKEDLTRETLREDWVHTGDIARIDNKGNLYIVDRKKDMIVTGGFNVYPREVEDILTADPHVAMAAVIGIPDPHWGEAVLAVVVPKPGMRVEPENLKLLVKEQKGAQHAPKQVVLMDHLPQTALGKVDKQSLRKPYRHNAGRQVA